MIKYSLQLLTSSNCWHQQLKCTYTYLFHHDACMLSQLANFLPTTVSVNHYALNDMHISRKLVINHVPWFGVSVCMM